MSEFTHFDENGNAYMVDVSGKDVTKRTATATGRITVSAEVMAAVLGRKIKKGDVFSMPVPEVVRRGDKVYLKVEN